ncbi:hypothetical protein A7X89_06360 [Stenotrophomonas maltophilia]|nr:hypothetical protein A7X89_06360 [Stenotrophomonas maltophilia]
MGIENLLAQFPPIVEHVEIAKGQLLSSSIRATNLYDLRLDARRTRVDGGLILASPQVRRRIAIVIGPLHGRQARTGDGLADDAEYIEEMRNTQYVLWILTGIALLHAFGEMHAVSPMPLINERKGTRSARRMCCSHNIVS